jgi:outer membrane lipoprotein-sorting protein
MVEAMPEVAQLRASRERKALCGSGSRLLGFVFAIALAGCAISTPATNPVQSAAIEQAETYFNGLQRFTARFTQTGSDGLANGYVWVDRPGRLRVEYVRPSPRLILANHGRLLIADHLTGATRNMPVSRTPLDILLAKKVAFSGDVTVTSLQQQDNGVQVTLAKSAAPSEGHLTLQFSKRPLALVGVVIQDSSGSTNTLALTDLQTAAHFDDDIFHYNPDPTPPN